ncbi:NAD-dependent epimerase/dehydratase family protein [Clostridium senegalense]|uniref:NAD-dependent epimerase/dehydratase family protein n=1 Tax=Clostridium senegalense TaxID=1465809 RepID=UPI001C11B867|nr:NAD-dependent epimerase/dehydratase family protein [Clostridium senegalense]MBU5225068.1 NAD-dependent epimerase/dehydratase family protein [Clostridium senegalense]
MKILILGASGFLGSNVFELMKYNKDFNVLGTCNNSTDNYDLIKLDITNEHEVKTLINKFNPDVILWSLISDMKNNKSEKYLIEIGLNNVLKNLSPEQKLIFISTNAIFRGGNGYYKETDMPKYRNSNKSLAEYVNAKIDGEKLVKRHSNHIIVRPGAIYGKYTEGRWDKRISLLIEQLESGKEIVRTKNLYNTFVNVDELAKAIKKLIEIDYKGIIHLGPILKESYYNFYIKIAKKLNLNVNLIKSNMLTHEEIIKDDGTLDLSIDTSMARELLGDIFSNI